jgi:hypothetical protein
MSMMIMMMMMMIMMHRHVADTSWAASEFLITFSYFVTWQVTCDLIETNRSSWSH